MKGWSLKTQWSNEDKDALTFGEGDNRCGCYIEVDDGLLVPRGYEGFSYTDTSVSLGGEIKTQLGFDPTKSAVSTTTGERRLPPGV